MLTKCDPPIDAMHDFHRPSSRFYCSCKHRKYTIYLSEIGIYNYTSSHIFITILWCFLLTVRYFFLWIIIQM